MVSSSSFPDEAVEAASDSPPPEDHGAYQDLLRSVASVLDIQAEEVCESSHKLVDILVLPALTASRCQFNEAIMEPIKVLWQLPSSLPPTVKRAERRYFVPSKGYEICTLTFFQVLWRWRLLMLFSVSAVLSAFNTLGLLDN